MGKILVVVILNQKSIVLVRFPFSNLVDYKIRPAIIVSNDYYNKRHSNFWIIPLTTKQSNKEFEIALHQEGIVKGTIEQKSFVRTDFIATVEHDRVLKEIGKVSAGFFKKTISKIQENLTA